MLSFLKLVRNWPKNAVLNLALCCGAIWRRREKPQHRCTTTVHPVYNCSKKILENLLPVGLLVRSNLFILSRFWTTNPKFDIFLLSALYSDVRKNFISVHIYILGPKLGAYCIWIFFKSLSYLYEVVRTLFRRFWTFCNFWPQFRENCGATYRRKWQLCSASERAIDSEKNGENLIKIDP